jgi:hypothetical protein
VDEAAAPGDDAFWTIEQLAARCGHYCWLERALFELAGSRASASSPETPAAAEPEIRVFLSVLAARHAALAAQWRARLPVRAGVDADALIVPPPGPAAAVLELIGSTPDLPAVLGGLVEQVLPRLRHSYGQHLERAPAASEAPVRAVLEVALSLSGPEMARGQALLRGRKEGPEDAGKGAELGSQLQHRLGDLVGVFPRARAS